MIQYIIATLRDETSLRDGEQLFLDWKLLVITAIRDWEEMAWTMNEGAGKEKKRK